MTDRGHKSGEGAVGYGSSVHGHNFWGLWGVRAHRGVGLLSTGKRRCVPGMRSVKQEEGVGDGVDDVWVGDERMDWPLDLLDMRSLGRSWYDDELHKRMPNVLAEDRKG